MSTQVEFLLLATDSQLLSTAFTSLIQLYSDNERVLVVANNRQHLEQLDEMLWHNSSEQFIPYSLDSECYSLSVAVLLTDNQPESRRFQALLNIGAEVSINLGQFRSIIELVHPDEPSKEKARIRYKHYRQLGFSINYKQLKENN